MEYRIVELLQEIKGMISGKSKEDNWVGIQDASDYCGVSTSTIRRAVSSNELSASKKLGKLLFKKSELESWLNN